ncbi:MAG TPA: hypothetical protein VGV35_20860, partial [Bryobacteraceae bacterium]|nr:hypothetical protein [Bryobacteraceae bacterium]
TYPNGRVLHYGYDNSVLDNDISRVDYLADDNPASGQAVGIHLQDYLYLGLSTIVQRADGNGVDLTYIKQSGESNGDAGDQYAGLDRFGRIVDQRWIPASSPSSPTDRFQYGYDRDSNVLYKKNLVSSSFSELYHANSSSSGDNATAYDNLNRLSGFRRGTLSASGNNGSGVLDTVSTLNSLSNSQQSFTLDGVGNQTSVTTDGTGTSRTVNSQNQITALGSTSLAYDNNGNTTTDDQGHTLIYNAWNQQVQVKNGSTVLTSYGFDADGRRIVENPGTANDLYFSSAGQVLEERQSGTIVNQNVWGLGYVNDLVLRDHFTSAGALDTTFGSGGKVTTTIGTGAVAWRDVIQPDGKIVVVGSSSGEGVVIRYNDDGTLDTSFGSSGIATVSGAQFVDGAIQSDGKIIAAGADGGNFIAARFNTDGTLDSSFGSSGIKLVNFGTGGSDYVNGVALDPDGKIVLAGPDIVSGVGDWGIVRLTTSGALDTTFNSTGKKIFDWGGDDWANGVVVQDSGKIVVVGFESGTSAMARFNTDGSLDTSFGASGTGKVVLTGDYAYRMNVQSLSDDRLLVTGVNSAEVVLHRFSVDGIADSSFGSGGTVLTSLGATDWGYDIGVQPDGKVVVVGGSFYGSDADGLAVRYNVDGSLDTTFGTSGTMLIWFGGSSYSELDYFESVAIQPDGQIVAVGTANGKFALARMNGGLTRLYAQQDANYNVTAVADVSGNVVHLFAVWRDDGVESNVGHDHRRLRVAVYVPRRAV